MWVGPTAVSAAGSTAVSAGPSAGVLCCWSLVAALWRDLEGRFRPKFLSRPANTPSPSPSNLFWESHTCNSVAR